MVQVDVFWSYGIGAGLGLASAHRAAKREPALDAVQSRESFAALLFLATVFAPSGVVLLWCFPGWETMHVGTRELPGWLVALFAVTNITQGLLGFTIARWLSTHGRPYAAYLQWVGAYFGMFFILVHGWDGAGYRRFFSVTAAQVPGWTWDTAGLWLRSDVALTLMVMGVPLVPWLVGLSARWWREALAQRGVRSSLAGLSVSILVLVVLGIPAIAVGASALIRVAGPALGTLAFVVLAWALLLRRGGLLHRHFTSLTEGRWTSGAVTPPFAGQRATQP